MSVAWKTLPFEQALMDVSAGNVKLQTDEYLPHGNFPIVDQGKALVAGYSDDPSALARVEAPIIVFGDHTRVFKYVDFPFCIGADGVRLLRPIDGIDTRYAFQFLNAAAIPSAGYSRHFKFLKRIEVSFPPLDEQRRIAAILDQADELRRARRKALQLITSYAWANFVEIFGDPISNQMGWDHQRVLDTLELPLRNGVSPSSTGTVARMVLTLSAVTGAEFDNTWVKEGVFAGTPPAEKLVSSSDFLVCRGNGNLNLVGRGFFANGDNAEIVFPDTMIAARFSPKLLEPIFVETLWNSSFVRSQIEPMARTTNGTFKINQTALEGIRLLTPPLDLQRAFAARVTEIDALKAHHRAHLARLDALFSALQHRAFRGEL